MKVKELIKNLVEYDMNDEVIILTKQDDIHLVNGEKFPNILFGQLEGAGENKERVPVLAIVGDYDKFKKDEEKVEAVEGEKKE